MKNTITLQDVLTAITTLSVSVDKKFKAIDDKFEAINQRLNRLETTIQEIQKSVDGLQEEMRGIHKVLDRFDLRITRLEKRTGLRLKSSTG